MAGLWHLLATLRLCAGFGSLTCLPELLIKSCLLACRTRSLHRTTLPSRKEQQIRVTQVRSEIALNRADAICCRIR